MSGQQSGMRLHLFDAVERGADGQPVVVCWYTDNHGQQAILRFPLALIEQMRQHALNARGTTPGAQAPRSNRQGVRTASVEAKVRAAYVPGMSVTQLERAAGVSRSAASKYWRLLSAVDL